MDATDFENITPNLLEARFEAGMGEFWFIVLRYEVIMRDGVITTQRHQTQLIVIFDLNHFSDYV